MNNPTNRDDEQIIALVALEEEYGPIVPGGAQGGAVARGREAKSSPTPAALRSRDRVRAQFRARAR